MKIKFAFLLAFSFFTAATVNAFDLKKEAKKALEKEKKKFEEQQRKEKEKKEHEKQAAHPAPAPTPNTHATSAPSATPPATSGAAVQPPAQPLKTTPSPAQNPPSATASSVAGATTPPAQNPNTTTTAEKIRQAWQKIPQAQNIYSPSRTAILPKNLEDESGGRLTGHLLSIYDFDGMEKLSGIPVFITTKGPDGKPMKGEFAQVNPKFVNWAITNTIPSTSDSAFKVATLQIYKDYLMKTVELFLHTIYGLESNPKKYAAMVKDYKDAIHSPQGVMSPESFIASMMNGLPEGTGAPITVGFWLRRSMDGSAPTLKAALEKLINTYTPERLSTIRAKFKK